jgi:hypothetical protein
MLIYTRKKAQSLAEYVMLFAIVVGAISLVRSYVMNNIAGSIQGWTDKYKTESGTTNTFDPNKSSSTGDQNARESHKSQLGASNLVNDHQFNAQDETYNEAAAVSGNLAEVKTIVTNHKVQAGTWDANIAVDNKVDRDVPGVVP